MKYWLEYNYNQIEQIFIKIIGFIVLGFIIYSLWYLIFSGQYHNNYCQYEYDGLECLN